MVVPRSACHQSRTTPQSRCSVCREVGHNKNTTTLVGEYNLSRVGSRPVSNHDGNMRDLQPEDLKGNEANQALNCQLKLNYHC